MIKAGWNRSVIRTVWKWYPTDVEDETSYAIYLEVHEKSMYLSMYTGADLLDMLDAHLPEDIQDVEEAKAWAVATWRMTS